MENIFEQYFKKYKDLVATVDKLFNKVKSEYSECVKCETGCSDCCWALFDLSLIEAIYINHQFRKKIKGAELERMLQDINRTDRKIYMIKRRAQQELSEGRNEVKLLAEMGKERIKCPLLSEDNTCILYEFRPITCRLYGIPIDIEGMSHICGKTGFAEGEKYPTVKLNIIQNRLYEISSELVKSLNTKYIKMAEMLVPLSMALLTDYNEEYLGIKDEEKDEKK